MGAVDLLFEGVGPRLPKRGVRFTEAGAVGALAAICPKSITRRSPARLAVARGSRGRLFLRAVAAEEVGDVFFAGVRGASQRRLAFVIPGRQIGLLGEEQFHGFPGA